MTTSYRGPADVQAWIDGPIVTPTSRPVYPHQWRPIVDGTTPSERIAAALELLPPAFTALLPEFFTLFTGGLLDALVIQSRQHSDEDSLDDAYCVAYILATQEPGVPNDVFYGSEPEPQTPENAPIFWDSLPTMMRDFLTTVHGSFCNSEARYGPLPPSMMATFEQQVGLSDSRVNWPPEIPRPDRVMIILQTLGHIEYAVSPDTPPNTVIVIDSRETSIEPFWSELDSQMAAIFG